MYHFKCRYQRLRTLCSVQEFTLLKKKSPLWKVVVRPSDYNPFFTSSSRNIWRCQANLITCGVPEYIYLDVSLRIKTHEKNTFCIILSSLGNVVPPNFKLVHLGISITSSTRPLKVIIDTKEVAAHLLSTYNITARSGMVFWLSFFLTGDKILLQRKLLCFYHFELNQRIKYDEASSRIVFENGLPTIWVTIPRNGEFFFIN